MVAIARLLTTDFSQTPRQRSCIRNRADSVRLRMCRLPYIEVRMLLGFVASLSQIATAAEALLLVIFCRSETLETGCVCV